MSTTYFYSPKVGRTLAAYYITASEPEPAVPEPAPENSSVRITP